MNRESLSSWDPRRNYWPEATVSRRRTIPGRRSCCCSEGTDIQSGEILLQVVISKEGVGFLQWSNRARRTRGCWPSRTPSCRDCRWWWDPGVLHSSPHRSWHRRRENNRLSNPLSGAMLLGTSLKITNNNNRGEDDWMCVWQAVYLPFVHIASSGRDGISWRGVGAWTGPVKASFTGSFSLWRPHWGGEKKINSGNKWWQLHTRW